MSVVADTTSARDVEQRCRIVAAAERLFREIGYQKTTVADIARDLRMSPANVYRFFSAKSAINEAVARHLMDDAEARLRDIAQGPGTASERLRALVLANEAMNAARYVKDRKMHDMVEAAMDENWPTISAHIDRIDAIVEIVVASGMESGEFAKGDSRLAAKLVHTACVRFCHPRLLADCADRREPTSSDMVNFCLAALKIGAGARPAAS